MLVSLTTMRQKVMSEVAANSPLKGKKCVTSTVSLFFLIFICYIIDIVFTNTGTRSSKAIKGWETASKKATPSRSEELPDWVNAKWFQQSFVTTYMAYVGQSMDPWDMPPKLAVKTMQTIWNATGGKDYEVTALTAVYQKVQYVVGLLLTIN
jgi:hypothetical protein